MPYQVPCSALARRPFEGGPDAALIGVVSMATDAKMQTQTEQPATQPRTRLFVHTPRPHEIHNVNLLRKAELAAGSTNEKIAVRLTTIFQAMPTFWLII